MTICMAIVLFCCSFAQANLTNAGFETGELSPWYNARNITETETWNVTSADAHGGVYSATNVGNGELRQDFAPIPVNNITELSYWLRQPESAISAFDFFYSDGSGYENVVYLNTTDWQFFDVTSHLSPGKELVGFSIFGYSYGGPMEDRTYLDDVTLSVAIPAPGAIALGGVGVTLVGWLRRRKTL